MAERLEPRRLLASVTAALDPTWDQSLNTTDQVARIGGVEGQNHAAVFRKNEDIYVALYDNTGLEVTPAFVVSEVSTGSQLNPDIAMWADGSFVIVWVDANARDGSSYGVYGRLFDASGTPNGGDFQLSVSTSGIQDRPHVATGAAGEFVAVWESDHAGRGYRNFNVMARRYIDGTPGSEIEISDYKSWEPDVTLNADGNALVFFSDASFALRAGKLSPQDVFTGGIIIASNGTSPDSAYLPEGSAAVVYSVYDGTSGKSRIWMKRFDASLSPIGSATLISSFSLTTANLSENGAAFITADSAGNLAVVNGRYTGSGGRQSLQFTLISAGGTMDLPQTQVLSRTSYVLARGVVPVSPGHFVVLENSTRRFVGDLRVSLDPLTAANDDVRITPLDRGFTSTINGDVETYPDFTPDVISLDLGDGENVLSTQPTTIAISVAAGSGGDQIYTSGGADTVSAGDGNNFVNTGENDDSVNTGGGRDTIILFGGDDYAHAGGERDYILGYEGNDTIHGGSSSNTIYGGDGDDRLAASGSRDRLEGDGGSDRIYGGGGDDTLVGGGQPDRLYGGPGNDELNAGSSNDRLYGDEGDDTLRGGNQNDNLFGGPGTDILSGEAGDDILADDSLEIDHFLGGSGTDIGSVLEEDVIDSIEQFIS